MAPDNATSEVHRLRGEFAEAEHGYRQAAEWGRETQPGLAMLRLAQGQVDAAAVAIRRVADEATVRVARSQVLAAFVEIMLAAHDIHAARAAADELAQIADDLDALLVHAVAGHATGAVLLGEGDAGAALVVLRRAWAAWRELDAPYEAARVRVLIGLACRELGDGDTAAVELDAARSVFRQLGAALDLAAGRRAVASLGSPSSDGADPARARGAGPGGDGQDEPRDRRRAGHQRAHRRPARAEHLRQAGRLIPHGGQRVCIRARSGLTHRRGQN